MLHVDSLRVRPWSSSTSVSLLVFLFLFFLQISGKQRKLTVTRIYSENNSLRGLQSEPFASRTPKTVSESGHKSPSSVTSVTQLPKLRVLRLSSNRLETLDVALYPNLRTLYVDNNCLADKKDANARRLVNLSHLVKLENFSARNQSGGGAREGGL